MLRGRTRETPVSVCPNFSPDVQPRKESARLGTAQGGKRREPLRWSAGVTPTQAQTSPPRPTRPSPSALSPTPAGSLGAPPPLPTAGSTPIFPVFPVHEVPRPDGRGLGIPGKKGKRGEGASEKRAESGGLGSRRGVA